MITDITVQCYQSICKARIRLGWFTVITGPTGSGKSAIIRAVRLAAFNARGNSYVTRGEKTCSVAIASEPEHWAVAITRGAVSGRDSYRLVTLPVDQYSSAPDQHTFTKLGGKVPEEVTAVHRLSDLNFAAQFDRPFLLSESAGDVAKILGRLTNVTLLFEAAREAARRKRELAARLRSREADLARLTAERERFAGLPARVKAVSEAEESLARAREQETSGRNLAQLASRLQAAQDRLEAAQAALPTIPATERLEALMARRERLRGLIAEAAAQSSAVGGWKRSAQEARTQGQEAAAGLHDLLVKAGRCPTCGSAITAKHSH